MPRSAAFGWVEQGVEYSWHYSWILDAIIDITGNARRPLLEILKTRIIEHAGKFTERDRLLHKLRGY